MKIHIRELQKVLNESMVNPNKPGPWKVIADLGITNPDYLRLRVIELLDNPLIHNDDLRKAISMLLLARYIHAKTELSRIDDWTNGGTTV